VNSSASPHVTMLDTAKITCVVSLLPLVSSDERSGVMANSTHSHCLHPSVTL
jgi:hypothetical protein